LKDVIIKYKSVIKFIVTFLLVYAVLSFSYKLYLDYSDGSDYYPDYVTNLVARQSQSVLQAVGYDAEIAKHPEVPSMNLYINGKFLARIVEGCNSVSIIILFISFMVAFASSPKVTFFYTLAGSVLIYSVNLLRIAIITIGLYHYPWRKELLHTIIFPLIIYGMVFLLWVFWVNRFSTPKKSKDA